VNDLLPILRRARGVLMVEAGHGQLEDEMRLALSHAGIDRLPPIRRVQHFGGVLPQQHEIVEALTDMAKGSATASGSTKGGAQ
jgi:hypothetical protein